MSTGRVRGDRTSRVAARSRPESWRRPPLRIETSECISCDACIAACPPSLGAVFRVDQALAIVPELCSGCGLCVGPACPVDCIYTDVEWTATTEDLWGLALGPADPYTRPDPRLTTGRVRRW
jgi:Na+-translocating ferredoxin:NAD+ oxidoreductase subunit B